MAEQSRHLDLGALIAALRLLHREVESLRAALSRSEERAYGLLQNVIALETTVAPKCADPMNGASAPTSRRRPPADSTFLLKLAAQSGVEKLEFEWLADGAALVRVDGGKAFPLPPTVAAFLETLALDKPGDAERLVGWKSREEVRAGLQKRLGRKFSRHALDELLRRLRSALVGGGMNPFLVQTHRQFGLRFALRRARTCDEP